MRCKFSITFDLIKGKRPPPLKDLILAQNKQFIIDQACAIFLESPQEKDPKDNVSECQTCKYTNTKTNTNTIHKYSFDGSCPKYAIVLE